MNFENFQINLLPAVSQGFNSNIRTKTNEIGSSEMPYGLRKAVINHSNSLEIEDNIKTLAGKIVHYALEKPEIIYFITKEINKAIGYTEKEINCNRFLELNNGKYLNFTTHSEFRHLIEIYPNQFLRLTPDINSNLYTIEIKTTHYPKKMWSGLEPYHQMQLNTHLGFLHHEYGFLLKLDVAFVKSVSKKWERIWNDYITFYPVNFNQKLFDFTIQKTKKFFDLMNAKDLDLSTIPCPEFAEWECDSKCKEKCPNPIEIVDMKVSDVCFHCKEEIKIGTKALTRNGDIYHYTSDKTDQYEQCVEAAKKAYTIKEVE